jgi:hypothetical protein
MGPVEATPAAPADYDELRRNDGSYLRGLVISLGIPVQQRAT